MFIQKAYFVFFCGLPKNMRSWFDAEQFYNQFDCLERTDIFAEFWFHKRDKQFSCGMTCNNEEGREECERYVQFRHEKIGLCGAERDQRGETTHQEG